MSRGRDERCPCGSGEEYARCCLLYDSDEDRFEEFWARDLVPGMRELARARLHALYQRRPGTEPLILEAFIASGMEPESAERERVRLVADLMAMTPCLWGDELGAELNRRVPLSSLPPRAEIAARALAEARLGVWDVFEDEGGGIIVESVAAPCEASHLAAARIRPVDQLIHPPCKTSVGWLVPDGALPVYIEHLGLDPDASVRLVVEGMDRDIIDDPSLSIEEADLALTRLAVELHRCQGPAHGPPPFCMSAIVEPADVVLGDPRTRDGVMGRTLMWLTRPGPACEALLTAETEEALLEAARDARWRGETKPGEGPRGPAVDDLLEQHAPVAAILESLQFGGDVVFADERRLASCPVALLGGAEGASSARAATGRSIRDALAAASGEKEELEAAWRTFRAEQRGLLLLRTLSQELSMPRLLLAMSYELARWILVEVSPGEVGDTPLRALSMPRGPLARLVAGLRGAYDLPHEPRLRDLPETGTELRELKGVGLKCEEELVAALMDHLADWRYHRAGLPPEQLPDDDPEGLEAAAALEAGLTDLETLFT